MDHVLFLETKKNIIVNGTFTKIVYSNAVAVLNAIYLNFPLVVNRSVQETFVAAPSNSVVGDGHPTAVIMTFPVPGGSMGANVAILQHFAEIEQSILQYYQCYFGISKTANFCLFNQLKKGYFKVYRPASAATAVSTTPKRHGGHGVATSAYRFQENIILKISGVWETASEVGITYKFMLAK